MTEPNRIPNPTYPNQTPKYLISTHTTGGKELRVTEANKRVYVDLIARHRMTTSIRAQIAAFLEGFWELVPRWVFCCKFCFIVMALRVGFMHAAQEV